MFLKETENKKVLGGPSKKEEGGLINVPSSSFRGNFDHTIDDKGRVSLPAEFRVILDSRNQDCIILTNYVSQGARCIEGFDLDAWTRFEGKLREKSRFNAKVQKLENFYISRAAECSLDKAGRILLPQHLRTYASIEREVTFTSSMHGFRIWNSKVWQVVFSEAEQALIEDPEMFSDVDI